MRNFILLLFTVSIISCNEKENKSESISNEKQEIDIDAELEAIASFRVLTKRKEIRFVKTQTMAEEVRCMGCLKMRLNMPSGNHSNYNK